MSRIRYGLIPTLFLAAAAAAPSVGHAQATIKIGVGGSGGTLRAASKKSEAALKAGSVSADSLATLKTFAKTKNPIIVIDGSVTTFKALSELSADRVGTVEFQQGEAEVKHYGKQAENGVLIFRTVKASANKEKDRDAKKGGSVRLNGGNGQSGTIEIKMQ